MFDRRFLDHWTTNRKLIWLVGVIAGGASAVWKTLTGTLLHITDALASPMQKCEVTLEPVQDLHGQDAPYPAGGGANLMDIGSKISEKTIAGVKYTSDENYITLDGTKSGSTYAEMQELTVSLKAGTYYAKAFAISGTGACSIYMYNGADLTANIIGTERTFTLAEDGNVWLRFAVWTDGQVFSNYKLGIVLSKSTISAWSPFANICPITGWTGCKVNRTGVNVWDEEWEIGSYSDTTGEKISGTRFINKNRISIKPNTSYYLKLWSGAANDMRILYYDANGSYLEITGWIYQGEFTTPADAYYMNFFLAGSYGTTYNHDISINYPSTDHDYHAYSGTTLSVTFPNSAGTVYGGTLDVVSGVLTVDRAFLDLGSPGYARSSIVTNGFVAYTNMPDNFPIAPDTRDIPNWLCSQYLITSNIGLENPSIDYAISWRVAGSSKGVIIKDSTYASYYSDNDMESFKTAMSGVQLVYELAEPIEIQLTPQPISTLAGENNAWSNTNGDTTVIYKAQAE